MAEEEDGVVTQEARALQAAATAAAQESAAQEGLVVAVTDQAVEPGHQGLLEPAATAQTAALALALALLQCLLAQPET